MDKDFTITWNTDLDTTMGDLVNAINNTTGGSTTFVASYADNVLTLTAKAAGAVKAGAGAGVPTAAPTNNASLTVTETTAGADAVAAGLVRPLTPLELLSLATVRSP